MKIKMLLIGILILNIFSLNSMIIINGVSCTGKTTTAKAVCKKLESLGYKAIHFSIDDFYEELIINRYAAQILTLSKENRNAKLILSDIKKALSDDTSIILCLFHERFKKAKEENPNSIIVVDHYMDNDYFLTLLHVCNNIYPQMFVKLICSKGSAQLRLEQRNQNEDKNQFRGKKSIENHFSDTHIKSIYGNKIYDLELDNSDLTPEECANEIVFYYFRNPLNAKDENCKNNKNKLEIFSSLYPSIERNILNCLERKPFIDL